VSGRFEDKTHSNIMMCTAVRMLDALQRARWPRHGSKFSNRIYDEHQLLTLLVLKEQFAKSYREFCVWLEISPPLQELLGLRKVPHFTTLHKFLLRTGRKVLERLLPAFLTGDGKLRLAIDSTGFGPTNASRYYITVLGHREDGSGCEWKRREVRRFLRQTVAVDIASQLVLAMRVTLGPDNDFRELVPTLDKLRKRGLRIAEVLADKGYDSEENRRFIHLDLKARPVIPLRAGDRPGIKFKGKYRRRDAREFDALAYRQRSLVESVHSVIKRRQGSFVRERSEATQTKQLIIRVLSYNARRAAALQRR